ncbi:MAG: hypothetical protein HFF13_07965 [Angelakisella sp.]|nr:hypothetical protein [Angelakisella sp.]
MNAVVAKMMGQAVSNGMFTGYARANNLRLAQLYDRSMVSAMGASRQVEEAKGLNPTLDSVHTPLRPRALSFQDSAFLRDYRDNMLDIQTAASRVGSQGADRLDNLAAMSTDPAVAEARGRLEKAGDRYTVKVEQLAAGQVDRSAPLEAESPLPTASGSIRLETGKGRFDFYMSGAGMENNREMLENFAAKLNSRDTGVTASVREKEGSVTLQLENSPGEKGSFEVKGTLAKRLDIQKTQEAGEQEAVYTVRKNGGQEERFTSEENTVSLGGITLKLKGEGTTEITGSNDAMEGMAEALSSLVDQFNSTLNYLNRTGENRTGVHNQIRRMVQPPVSEKSMSLIGLTSQRDGSYTFDREAFMNQARRSPSLVRGIAEDFAQGLRSDAQRGMRESSGSLLDTTDYSAQQYVRQVNTEAQMSPVNVLSTYSRNGVFNLMNFYTAGVLMNLNA